MSIVYIVVHSDRPYIALFQGTLDEAALAVFAQPNAHELTVYANDGATSRDLTAHEQLALHPATSPESAAAAGE